MVNMKNEGLLRRRGVLSPLAANAERGLEDADLFSTLYISPCQVQISNDPFTTVAFQDLVPCNATSYECPNARENVTATSELKVSYDFELRYKTNSDLDTSLAALEGSQLQHEASLTGLLDCGAFSFTRSGSSRKLQSAELLSSSEKAALVAISSEPKDFPDPDHSTCLHVSLLALLNVNVKLKLTCSWQLNASCRSNRLPVPVVLASR